MANPSYLSTCCCVKDDLEGDCDALEQRVLLESPVDITCLVTSVVSVVGVIYLLLPRPDSDLRNTLSTSQTRILAGRAVREIIHILILCDVLAVLGVITRSVVKLSVSDSINIGFCNFINIWIQFFYLCGYFWNIVYGVELLFSVKSADHSYMKYVVGFLPPVLLIVLQILMVYASSSQWCLEEGLDKLFVYLSMILPVIFVLIITPIIFYTILKSVRKSMIGSLGRFGTMEREVLNAARFKFTSIVIIFIFCWLPNLIFAVLQLFEERNMMYDVFLAVATIQAITNPLQAILNCMVYRGWPGALTMCSNQSEVTSLTPSMSRSDLDGSIEVQINSLSSRLQRSTETDPILNFRNQRQSYTS
ncbi:hypothetical protein LOTGIDRAFT_163315 [Lottia gigantea]|uniref:G-protein coupled receptors family 1 profile domain-containing protein n=1 Tax=Lottia gigantea TaxID=225164 RepID=V4A951_LOTGI|nr:hypothetical protein LOTGIDRAFT_163315 [Lottia gigantea]ESO91590.1 hypothetical protein LOTGIDRAFT_163315 [Lottia gigantea]